MLVANVSDAKHYLQKEKFQWDYQFPHFFWFVFLHSMATGGQHLHHEFTCSETARQVPTLSPSCLCLSHTHARWQMHARACAVTSSSVVDWQKQMSLKRRCCKTLCFCVCVCRRKCMLVWAETHDEMRATGAWPRLPCNAKVTLHLADGQISVEPINSWSQRQQLNECLHKIRRSNTNKLIAFRVADGSLLKTHRPAAGVWAGCRPERDWRFL